jgi:hypothetical protein
MDFDEDPLDLLDDDGDGVIEMGLFFDDDKKWMIAGVNRLETVDAVSWFSVWEHHCWLLGGA